MNWINVNEQVPDKNDWEYIVSGKDGSGKDVVSTLNYKDGKWHSDILNKDVPDGIITHWMPLPEPPQS